MLEVIDKGIGIPNEEQNKLFSQFFRAKNASHIRGIGLGLNIVKHYVLSLGGSIGCVSLRDKGTTFTVKLPVEMR